MIQRQQPTVTATVPANGPDLSIRCRTKKERERIKRAARSCGISVNRFALEAILDRCSIVEASYGK